MQAVYVIFFALFILMALAIAIKLPQYLWMTQIIEEQRALLHAIQNSVSDGILLIGEDGQIKSFKPLSEMKERIKTVVPGQLYVFRDITEMERLQARLIEAQRLESLSRLAEGVGHEFNNLLTGIMGNAGLALDRLPAGDPVRAMLDDVIRASGRAAAVSRQLQAYSSDTRRFIAHPLDLSALVENLAGLAQASLSKRIQFRMELTRDLPWAEADAAKVRQVALNLIANGAEAIGNANGTVTVRTGVAEIDAGDAQDLAPGRYAYLEVQDDGCGMDEEAQSHIFDPFFTTKSAGRGLGLAAVLGIVRAHHGAIKVHSESGKGSTFRVLLPAVARSLTRAAGDHA